MTVEELIEELRLFDQKAEVRFASQPSWPFEYSINGVVQAEVDKPTQKNNHGYETEDVVYLEEGRQIGYLPGGAKDELGW